LIGACDSDVMTTNPDLAKQIEDLVRQHVDALRASAAAAVARAFAAATPLPQSARASTPARPVRSHPRKQAAPRRAPEELVALGERFYVVLCQRPGETMTTLAPQVGVAPRVLQVAVARLRRDGRVRVIGKKQQMRYYPMAPSATAPSATTPSAVAPSAVAA
jgi:hypothetical protein